VQAAAEHCPDAKVCVQSKLAAAKDTIDIIVKTKIAIGWTSIGLGEGMQNADIVVRSLLLL
jgi:hypothetical protein